MAPKVNTVTHLDVDPADRPEDREIEVKSALSDLAQAVVSFERRAYEVRRDLAGNTIKIIQGHRGW